MASLSGAGRTDVLVTSKLFGTKLIPTVIDARLISRA
jgi:hypothetical protein